MQCRGPSTRSLRRYVRVCTVIGGIDGIQRFGWTLPPLAALLLSSSIFLVAIILNCWRLVNLRRWTFETLSGTKDGAHPPSPS